MTGIEYIASDLIHRSGSQKRYVIAVAGPPGAGKSTFAQALCSAFPQAEAAVFQMDGYHYDNAILDRLSLRSRKGAPETFDFAGFEATLRRIRSADEPIAVPAFDRSLDLARAGAAIITKAMKFIIVEGNYLLLSMEPWSGLSQIFDYKIFLQVERDELERRLISRWTGLGIETETARRRVAENDMPNIDHVLSFSTPADMIIGKRGAEYLPGCD
jgi:pantothenate kinase